MIETMPAVRREVTVRATPATAFRVFTAEMTAWWPAAHHIGSAPIAEVVVEPRVGGRWFTRHEDGTETSTGFVTAWEPAQRFTVTWQIGSDWCFHDDLVTTLDITFHETADGRTRVVLEHRGLEAYGDAAAAMRELYERPDAWAGSLAAYAAAVAP